ncbi:hypothetical protein ACRW9N_11640 [Listeria aquatica]
MCYSLIVRKLHQKEIGGEEMKKKIGFVAVSLVFLGSLILGPQQPEAKFFDDRSVSIANPGNTKIIEFTIHVDQKNINEETTQVTGYLSAGPGTSETDLKGLFVKLETNESVNNRVSGNTTGDSGKFTIDIKKGRLQATQNLYFRVSNEALQLLR